jgi:hypothetical protein
VSPAARHCALRQDGSVIKVKELTPPPPRLGTPPPSAGERFVFRISSSFFSLNDAMAAGAGRVVDDIGSSSEYDWRMHSSVDERVVNSGQSQAATATSYT